MTPIHDSRPELQYFVAAAQQERAEAMSRSAYLMIDAVGRLGGAIHRRLVRALGAAAGWRSCRAAARALERLDDRMLQDIGLTRADIWAVAHGRPTAPAAEGPAAPEPAAIDIALSERSIRGCNDNGTHKQAA